MRIIFGLGNPGKEYQFTRHNVGFVAVDHLADTLGIEIAKSKFQALYGEGSHQGEKVVLVKPLTYMNLSGQSVRQVLDWYKPTPSEWVVVYDDMDLPLGTVRLRVKGSSGGHNGIKSIISTVGSQEFQRVRIGVGRPAPGKTVIDHVLSSFHKEENARLEETYKQTTAALHTFIQVDFQTAMNRYN
ncbi:aminoacyl-tRNA hydrolase [Effusibacillus dendaii]|uniref:Peptidyl-tRNA hydrolase n=1 Tax=Effusibacillus dendaii TaxID=2743772 RepID=A0A7I8DEM8_9BACL|nr:aminoacyl-tRNA hydrolase [Effusibacillus dendaii]BCJ87409.1 peptidyl-tRNA hydrolase [Effusibacillus dendaii]